LIVATALLCFGRNIATLVIGRLLQGLAAAIVWVSGMALLVDTFGSFHIGQAMGYIFMSMSTFIMTTNASH
jgi:MFS family permease